MMDNKKIINTKNYLRNTIGNKTNKNKAVKIIKN
jgi:hypothetical protein